MSLFRRLTIAAFASLGVGAALAGIVIGGQLGQTSPNDLQSLTFDVVAAVLVGGISIEGGSGSPLRAAAGAVLIATINNIMLLNGFSTGVRLALSGLLVAAVVLFVHIQQ